ncbi:MAG: DNRLRE domain-containing protein [Nitrospirae bacterium]|nr:DNRLRE domain-containing protein [Candidatus Manganitrophaceae bacterium]
MREIIGKRGFVLFISLFSLIVFNATASAMNATLTWDANTDSRVAGYKVYYGTASGIYLAAMDVGKQTSYSLTNLPDQTHYFTVTAYDGSGNESAYADEASKTPPPDTAAPLISSINVSGITTAAATITWGTDEGADTQVQYGTTTTYGSSTTLATAKVTVHSQSLSGLQPSTLYHYRVLSRDAAGNLATSLDNTFTTAAIVILPPPPVVTPSPSSGTVTLSPMTDTYLNVDTSVNNADVTLNTYTWPANQAANAILMEFSLSALPAGAVIQSATLNLSLVEADTEAEPTYTVTVHKLINKNPDLTQATGYSYDGINSWTANDCCANSVPLAQADISAAYDTKAIDKTLGVKRWDMTQMVKEWIAGPATNYGLLLNSDTTKGADRYRFFGSMENPNASLRPSLTIIYTAADTTPPVLSGMAAGGIGGLAATIRWTSNEPATSQVEYGTTTAYGSRSLLDVTLLNAHSVLLAGLNPLTTYHYRVLSRDASGNTAASGDATFTTTLLPDLSSPSVPTGLTATAASQSLVNLVWKASTDNVAVAGYRIYRNGAQVGTTTSLNYADTGLSASTTYNYTLSAYDAAGNASPQTAAVSATTSASSSAIRLTLTPTMDSYLNVDSSVNNTDATLNTYTWPDNQIANVALMKFDLKSLPPGAIIQSATLYLSLVEADTEAEPTYMVSVHKLINKNPDLTQATGYTYDGINSWTANNCCADNIPLAQGDISAAYDTKAIDKVLGRKSWNVTAIIQNWMSSPATNYGLLLNSDATKGSDRYRYFASMENPNASLRPSLRIYYLLP